jgi:hypothetical protein
MGHFPGSRQHSINAWFLPPRPLRPPTELQGLFYYRGQARMSNSSGGISRAAWAGGSPSVWRMPSEMAITRAFAVGSGDFPQAGGEADRGQPPAHG